MFCTRSLSAFHFSGYHFLGLTPSLHVQVSPSVDVVHVQLLSFDYTWRCHAVSPDLPSSSLLHLWCVLSTICPVWTGDIVDEIRLVFLISSPYSSTFHRHISLLVLRLTCKDVVLCPFWWCYWTILDVVFGTLLMPCLSSLVHLLPHRLS